MLAWLLEQVLQAVHQGDQIPESWLKAVIRCLPKAGKDQLLAVPFFTYTKNQSKIQYIQENKILQGILQTRSALSKLRLVNFCLIEAKKRTHRA